MRKYEKLWNYIKSRDEDTITLTFEETGETAFDRGLQRKGLH